MSTAAAERPAKAAPKPKPDRRKAPVAEFEIPRDDWIEIVSDAALFADRSGYFPTIEAVKLRVSADGQIVASASDRFTLGIRRYSLPSNVTFGAEVLVLLPVDEVTAMGRLHARARRGNINMLTITIRGALPGEDVNHPLHPGEITVRSEVQGRTVSSTHPGVEAEPIDFEGFAEPADGEASIVALNPEYLARFGKVSRDRGESMRIRFAAKDKPVTVKIGDHFTGAIMPARFAEDGDAR